MERNKHKQKATGGQLRKTKQTSRPTISGTKFPMQAIVTLSVLAAALYVILSGHYQKEVLSWAFGTVAAFVGFWLRGR